MSLPRVRKPLLLAILATLMFATVGVAAAAPSQRPGAGVQPAQPQARLQPAPAALDCHLDGSRVEYTATRVTAVAKADCKDGKKAHLGVEVILREFDGNKVGRKVRERCPDRAAKPPVSTCTASTDAPRKPGKTYCLHAYLAFQDSPTGEIKSRIKDRCDDPAQSPTPREERAAHAPAEPLHDPPQRAPREERGAHRTAEPLRAN